MGDTSPVRGPDPESSGVPRVASGGPRHFAEFLAGVEQPSEQTFSDGEAGVLPKDARYLEKGNLSYWFLHETQTLREPIYRTEARDAKTDVGVALADPRQLALIKYEYDNDIAVISQMGELTARDLRVMSVIQHVFYETGCPTDNAIRGDEATYGYICRQLGLDPAGYVKLIRNSIERLATAKVLWKLDKPIVNRDGVQTGSEKREVAVGFLTNWGARERKVKGQREEKANFILIDPIMAQFIRAGHFTWLRADVMRKLANHAIATKLYAYMRTHRPNDRGEIEYGVMNLAAKLGVGDKKKSRVTAKIQAAATAVVAAAPGEFPAFHLRPGHRDHVIVLKKVARRTPAVDAHPEAVSLAGQRAS